MSDDEKAQARADQSEDEELEVPDEAAGQVRGGAEALSLSFQKIEVTYKPQKAD